MTYKLQIATAAESMVFKQKNYNDIKNMLFKFGDCS